MSLKEPVTVDLLPDGRKIKVVKSFSYYRNKDEIITVPEGSISDGASIPKLFWWIIGSPLTGKYRNASILHDYIYSKGDYTRKNCDLIFYEAMGILKVIWWRRKLMYRMVRIFGWVGWNKYRKQEKILCVME